MSVGALEGHDIDDLMAFSGFSAMFYEMDSIRTELLNENLLYHTHP